MTEQAIVEIQSTAFAMIASISKERDEHKKQHDGLTAVMDTLVTILELKGPLVIGDIMQRVQFLQDNHKESMTQYKAAIDNMD
jgi:hypothetical protein